jgi:hypothetical protein
MLPQPHLHRDTLLPPAAKSHEHLHDEVRDARGAGRRESGVVR